MERRNAFRSQFDKDITRSHSTFSQVKFTVFEAPNEKKVVDERGPFSSVNLEGVVDEDDGAPVVRLL